MVGIYDVKIGEEKAGEMTVEKQGLYYRFSCRCKLSGKTVHSVAAVCGGERVHLGVCVPMDGRFGLDKKLPCKQFAGMKPEFRLIPRSGNQGRKFVPVYPEEPFAYMAKLKDSFMEIRDGQVGVSIPE